MAPEDVTQSLLVDVITAHPEADGFLIEGYPRTMKQVSEYKRIVSVKLEYIGEIMYES